MKLLHILAPGPIAGLERSALASARALEAHGHDVTLAVVSETRKPDAAEAFVGLARADGLRCRVMTSRGRADPRLLLDMRSFVSRGHFDVVHSHSYKTLAYLSAFRRWLPPLVATYHGATSHTRTVRLYEWIERTLFNRVDCLFVVSHGAVDALERHGRLRCRVAVVPNMISGAVPSPSRRRARAGAPIELLCLGRLSVEKGADVLVTALAELKTRHPFRLTIVGDGPARASLEEMAARCGIGEHVSFEGFQADVAPYLRASDLLVMPSRTEAMPMALIEAAASGLPVVASNVGGIPEIVTSGKNGVLVPPDSPSALSAAIAEVAVDLERFRREARSLRKTILEAYGPDRWVARAVEEYSRLVSR
jgi:glycosyltransferase involved in cell wall biosynthesis